MEPYLTVKDVALLLQLSVQTIRCYTMNREIPFHKMNRAVRYKKSEIEVWFEKRGTTKGRAIAENLEGGLFWGAASDETGEKT
jgi:excisionase family DNA binding protein